MSIVVSVESTFYHMHALSAHGIFLWCRSRSGKASACAADSVDSDNYRRTNTYGYKSVYCKVLLDSFQVFAKKPKGPGRVGFHFSK